MQENQPLVSIIIPVFNRADLLAETVKSVTEQTYEKWECLLCDDGSEISEFEKINKIAKEDDRIKLLPRNRLPKGRSTSRNIGMDNAKGEFILFLDSDDLLEKNCLENRIAEFRKNPECDFLIFNHYFLNNEKITEHSLIEKNHLKLFLSYKLPWSITSPLWKAEFIKQFRFHEQLSFLEDPEISIKILVLEPKYKLINRFDWYYRIVDSSQNDPKRNLKIIENIKILIQSLIPVLKTNYVIYLIFYVRLAVWGFFNDNSQISEIKEIIAICRKEGIVTRGQLILKKIYILFFRLKLTKIIGVKGLFYMIHGLMKNMDTIS